MTARIGIDVGGTYTDAVFIRDGEIIRAAKVPTKQNEILETVLQALDALNPSSVLTTNEELFSITVSTTLVTNSIVQKRLPPVELLLIPGSGVKPESLPWPVPYRLLSGELDFRGREVSLGDQAEWQQLARELKTKGEKLAVISGKFAHRNHVLEQQLAAFLHQELPDWTIALGSEWGKTNFFRRSLTAYLNLAVKDQFTAFCQGLEKAVRARGLSAPLKILKADGGMLPAEMIRPVESVYSGPAASVLGAMAESEADQSYIVVDIGGTTTDIGLVLSGKPLLASRGAQIGDFLTNVSSLAVRSVPLGGDSVVLGAEKDARGEGRGDAFSVQLAEYRIGPAYCLGGESPTPTDAMRYLGLIDFGSFSKAEEAMARLLPSQERDPAHLKGMAESIFGLMVEKIATAVENLLESWKKEPAYKIWQVLHPQWGEKFPLRLSGGGATGIAPALAKRLNTRAQISKQAMNANAVGAAMAKPTFSWTLNLDTSLKRYRIEETGEQGVWQGSLRPHREVESFLTAIAQKQITAMGLTDAALEIESFDYFPLVEGFRTAGQIVRGRAYLPPGALQLAKEADPGKRKGEQHV